MTFKVLAVVSFWLFVTLFLAPKTASFVLVPPSTALQTRRAHQCFLSSTPTRVASTNDENEIDPKYELSEKSLTNNITGLNITILFESDRILAIDKPPGISHHDGSNTDDLGILSLLRISQQNVKLQYQGRLYGVHRLDRVTSGILLLAKDKQMASLLTRAFRDGNVTKYYIGVSSRRRSKKKQGWIKGKMIRGRRKSWYLSREQQGSSLAVTRFFTSSLSSLRESAVDTNAPPMTCILFRPYTGRTHQLRVAAKSVGLPLSGDPIYTDGLDSSSSARTFLHASAIHMHLGGDDNESITIWSPPPFHHLYKDDSEGNEAFRDTVTQLMKKYCDCDQILAAMNATSNSKR